MDGEGQREAIVAALRDVPAGLDTNVIAERVGLHPNTVRWHLGRLADQGFVRSAPERRRSRGRPSIVHRLTPEGVAAGRDEYRMLATMLTAALASDPEGTHRTCAERESDRGRALSAANPGGERREPARRGGLRRRAKRRYRIEMRRCPFYALAETDPRIVCTLHHGIIDGALAETGSPRRVERLDAFVEPSRLSSPA